MINKFSPQNFFDLSKVSFSDIFENVENIWEVIPKIKTYLESKSTVKPIIGKGTILKENVVIEGPCIIGEDCIIGPNSYIREGVIIGNGVRIGHACEIKNSIILNNTKIAHLSYVGDSLVGSDVNIAAGAICANFRFDGKKVEVRDGAFKYDTGLKKFGCVIGDGSQIGVNAILNPGSILGKNIVVWPLVRVFGTHKNDEVLK